MEQSSQSWVGMLRSYTCYFLLLQYLQHYTKEKGKYVIYMQFNIHRPNIVVIDLVILLTLKSHPRIKTVPLAFVTLSYIIRAAKQGQRYYCHTWTQHILPN